MTPIYLDWNATTPLLPQAWEAMQSAATLVGNPASAHHAGRAARRFLEDAREQVAARLGAAPDEVIFTSGATEANNIALFGLLGSVPGHVLAAPIEHPCVIEPLNQLAARGCAVEWLPVTPEGHVETVSVMDRIRDDTRLVSLMLVNHETGAIQPVRHVAKKLPKHIPLHCDAAQAIGKRPVNFHDLGVAALTASAHKFRGPTGVGLLLLRGGRKLQPLTFGGHQQRGFRPGTEPVTLAVGMAVALEHALRTLEADRIRTTSLAARLLDHLRTTVPPVIVNGPDLASAHRLSTTLNLSFPGCRADVLIVSLDLAGIACSTGSACSSGSLLPSPILRAMSVTDDILRSAIRFSFGPTLTDAEMQEAGKRIAACVSAVRNRPAP